MSNKCPVLRERANYMRRNPTEPEKRLWRSLSGSQLNGHKFRRQAVVGNHICDFLCAPKGLAIEVDGDTHCAETDKHRDMQLKAIGIEALHFTNADVMTNTEGVLMAISAALANSNDRWAVAPTPTPPLKERGF